MASGGGRGGDPARARRRRAAAMPRDERGRFVRAARPGEASERQDGRRATKAAGSTGSEGPSEGATKAMATPVKMPELGESITEGTITRWLKQEGDLVEADEPLFEISTDKVDTEVPSPVSGVLKSIKVHEDETVGVGAELAEIGGEGDGEAPAAEREAAPAREKPAEERAPARTEERPAEQAPAEQAPAEPAGGDGRAAGTVTSPLVRRLAREHDVDLGQVKGTGSGGRVRREDVEASLAQRGKEPAAAKEPTAAAAAGRRQPPPPPQAPP